MTDYRSSLMGLINYCNTQMTNSNEYNIARVILHNVDKLESMSLEELSKESNISQASVSRFIKKMGFKSYQEFRESFQKALLEMKLNRKLSHVTMFPYPSEDYIYDKLYEEALNNLIGTRERIDKKQLAELVSILKKANSVTFYGDDHTLSIFYTLQLDLLANGTPAYLFKTEEIQKLHSDFLQDDDIIVFLNVYTGFVTSRQKKMLKRIRKNKQIKMIAFSQENNEAWDHFFDMVIHYGLSNSINNGFYSLLYLSQLLSELYYHDYNHNL